MNIFEAVKRIEFIHRDEIKPNNYNPNKVSEANLQLLEQSIMTNGWTLPIVIRPDKTIIDGFHRWLIAGRDPLATLTEGMIPCVIVKHEDEAADIYGTITHNRARGTHLLEPMKAIVADLQARNKTVAEISKQLGMRSEEVYRLSNFSREDFLKMMAREAEYSQAEYITSL